MNRRLLLLLAFTTLLTVPLYAGFLEVVDVISHTRGLHRTDIPFVFGLARFVVRVGHPRGLQDIQLATFEGDAMLDGAAFATVLRDSVRDGYSPVVQTRSNREGEWSLIFARPSGGSMDLLIVTHDSEDTTVVRAVVDAEAFAREVNSHGGFGSHGRGHRAGRVRTAEARVRR